MNPNLWFWTGSFALLGMIVGTALLGFRSIRRGRIDRHRRFMTLAGGLTVFFLLAYIAKVLLLGKEDLAIWPRHSLVILWCHESVVGIMLLSGTAARLLARIPRLRPTWHKLCGRVCVATSTLALVTAGLVLVEMYQRSALVP